MRILGKMILICAMTAGVFWCGSVIAQRQQLSNGVIRLHVVANSDSEEDQSVKLKLRDAVTAFLQEELKEATSKAQAEKYLSENLGRIEALANRVLAKLETGDSATVSLKQEAFDTRIYDTFTMPAGVYDSLRIIIGEGQGKNWWCVVFPELCIPATAQGFSERAVECGYADSLTGAMTGEERYEVRFFLLDCLGKLENFFFPG